MLDDAAVLLDGAGQEPGHINEGHKRNVKAVAKANEAPSFDRGIDVENASQMGALVGADAYWATTEPGEADDHIAGKILVDLQEIVFVHHCLDNVLNIVRLGGVIRNDGVQLLIAAIGIIAGRPERRVFPVVARQEAQEFTNSVQTLTLAC